MSEDIHFLIEPGVPWNADVALLAVIYLAIGFYSKKRIAEWMNEDNKKYDVTVLIVIALLVIFIVFNYSDGRRWYYFDMKYLYYKELFLAVVIPSAFGLVLCRTVFWIEQCKGLCVAENLFAYLGRMTIPIMFMHVPLNILKEKLGYGLLVYILIGIGVPVVFAFVFGKFKIIRKMFGLPEI